mmetsp:Transcript_94590/g.131430  ORF Transcript_94590/g.131430 Transcript_94590/m.131430 type:complete len:172 (+) Transcript_94590:48-563(+)
MALQHRQCTAYRRCNLLSAFLLLCTVALVPRPCFAPPPEEVLKRRQVSAGAAALLVASTGSAALADIKAKRPEGLPDFISVPEKENDLAKLWKQWGDQPPQVGPADPSLSGLTQDERSGFLGVLVVAIFLVPVLVMSAFGSLIWFPWSRPSEEPKPGEKKVEIDFSDLRDM